MYNKQLNTQVSRGKHKHIRISRRLTSVVISIITAIKGKKYQHNNTRSGISCTNIRYYARDKLFKLPELYKCKTKRLRKSLINSFQFVLQ